MTVRSLADFEIWLTECGAEVLDTTSEWEVLRVRTSTGTHIVHQNRKGVQTWPPALLDIVREFNRGTKVALAATRRKRRSSRTKQEYGTISKRDGSDCFYCGEVVAPPETPVPDDYAVTIEHLVSVCHGGPDHLANKFLSHFKCNQIAGNLSAPEKIKLRDMMRAERGR